MIQDALEYRRRKVARNNAGTGPVLGGVKKKRRTPPASCSTLLLLRAQKQTFRLVVPTSGVRRALLLLLSARPRCWSPEEAIRLRYEDW